MTEESGLAGGASATKSVYLATYSSVAVFELMVRGIACMRRRTDGYINATQVLKIAGIEKAKRTKILEKEILTGEHEKVQGGYGKYQGTWYVQPCLLYLASFQSLTMFPLILQDPSPSSTGAICNVQRSPPSRATAAFRSIYRCQCSCRGSETKTEPQCALCQHLPSTGIWGSTYGCTQRWSGLCWLQRHCSRPGCTARWA
jgi:hypothetical protein